MINYREINYERDLDEVLDLLNSNFSTTHSKKAFVWKHLENPFGVSYGSLATDDERIIAVRMFMKWEFRNGSNIINSIRPVDTCTDKSYRGKGIFKQLNQNGLDYFQDEHDLIFNTPNANSKPGNLKMGWKPVPKNFQYQFGLIPYASELVKCKILKDEEEVQFSKIILPMDCHTNISLAFLKWRYKDRDYKKAQFEETGILIYKIQNLKGLRSLIVCDIFGDLENFNKFLFSVCIREKTLGVYFLKNEKSKSFKFLFQSARGGQTVVYRNDKFNIIEKINFSLSDLEARI